MEISKMLTVSTSHISKETAGLLTEICDYSKESELIIYPKRFKEDYYGWFIFVSEELVIDDMYKNTPKDLMRCLLLALKMECDWLCLDRDGEVLNNPYLDVYEW